MQSNIILLCSFHGRYCLMIPHVIPLDNSLESPAGFLRQFQQNKMLRHTVSSSCLFLLNIALVSLFFPSNLCWEPKRYLPQLYTFVLWLTPFRRKKNNNSTCLFYLSCLTTGLSNHKEIMAVMETSLEIFHSTSHIIPLNKVVIYLLNIHLKNPSLSVIIYAPETLL